jgi:hypothetical protein
MYVILIVIFTIHIVWRGGQLTMKNVKKILLLLLITIGENNCDNILNPHGTPDTLFTC